MDGPSGNETKFSSRQNYDQRIEKNADLVCDKNIKLLQMDNVKKQATPDVKKFLMKACIEVTMTAPNSSQSNAYSERSSKKLLANARAAIAAVPNMDKALWSFAAIDAADKSNYLPILKDKVENPRTEG